MKKSIVAVTLAFLAAVPPTHSQTMIGKNNITLQSDRMTPEALWAMGRVGGAQASPDGRKIVYRVGYYSVVENKGHQVLYVSNADGTGKRQLTTTADNETDAAWIEGGRRIAFLTKGQLWSMNPDGTDRRQLTHSSVDLEGFLFSPDSSSSLSPTPASLPPGPPTYPRPPVVALPISCTATGTTMSKPSRTPS